ncbi:MAG: hypothetical protein HY048_12745 [Acidobacteria bacterium]|nr:hypothetical protein [Acidobacteriota bacterium]
MTTNTDDTRRILDMLAQGKITVDEADRLLKALGAAPPPADTPVSDSQPDRPPARWLRVNVHKPANDHRKEKDVNIRVPIAVVKGGMRLGAIVAAFAGDHAARKMRERGFDLDLSQLDGPAFESLLKDMEEVKIEMDDGTDQVRITCE